MQNKNALALLLTANFVSGIAQGITMLAIPWYFFNIIDEAKFFGYLYAIITISTLPWNIFAGSLIDKYSRKKIFMGITSISGLLIGLIALYGFSQNGLSINLIALVFIITILNFSIHYPTLYAFGQEITEKSKYHKLSTYFEIQNQVGSMFSGAIAVILLSGVDASGLNFLGLNLNLPFEIEAWPIHKIFAVDAITYFIAFTLILLLKYKSFKPNKEESRSTVQRIRAGFTYLKDNPLLLMFGTLTLSVFIVILVEAFLLLPQYVANHLNESADVFASGDIYYSLGAILAGFITVRLFKQTTTLKGIIVLMMIAGGIFIWIAFTFSLFVFYLISLLIGFTNAGVRILRVTYLFRHINNDIMGRVSSIFSMTHIVFRALLIYIFSYTFFTESNNVIYAYLISGVFVLISIIPLLINYKTLVALKINETS
ncbi:MAG: MFS transporter [Bacteroidia bacterium]|nr:MFS transporter [Bacteroidia bacterium]